MAHNVTFAAARLAHALNLRGSGQSYQVAAPALEQTLWGIPFANPIGLAAGMDKNAVLLPEWERIGFGHVEVGSVTRKPSKGNARPRLFRLKRDRAIVNRMGLNNKGADRLVTRLSKQVHPVPISISVAKSHDPSILGADGIMDVAETFRMVAPYADMITLNVSCPNTAEGKTFEDAWMLDQLLRAVGHERAQLARDLPVLVKIGPPALPGVVFDSQLDEVLAVCTAHGIDGIVAVNTSNDRHGVTTSTRKLAKIGKGGLSGQPLRNRTLETVRYIYERTRGSLPIVAVGGVDSEAAAYEMILNGASMVQVYTGLVYQGPHLVRHIKLGLSHRLEQDGYHAISQAVGAAHRA